MAIRIKPTEDRKCDGLGSLASAWNWVISFGALHKDVLGSGSTRGLTYICERPGKESRSAVVSETRQREKNKSHREQERSMVAMMGVVQPLIWGSACGWQFLGGGKVLLSCWDSPPSPSHTRLYFHSATENENWQHEKKKKKKRKSPSLLSLSLVSFPRYQHNLNPI